MSLNTLISLSPKVRFKFYADTCYLNIYVYLFLITCRKNYDLHMTNYSENINFTETIIEHSSKYSQIISIYIFIK